MDKKIFNLLDQIIEQAKIDDEKHKEANRNGNASKTVGESWMVFHLKSLRELLTTRENEYHRRK